jgi:hypothetical protein
VQATEVCFKSSVLQGKDVQQVYIYVCLSYFDASGNVMLFTADTGILLVLTE